MKYKFILFSINFNLKGKYSMNINAWNLSQTKTTFFIRQRKQAQKKHLQKLKNIKSTIHLNNSAHTSDSFYPIVNLQKIAFRQSKQKSPSNLQKSFQQNSLVSSFVRKTKSPTSMNSSYIDNLRVSSSLSRLRHNQQIQKENSKLIERLIKAKPSISENQFKKNHLKNIKYKQNILKNKYLNPDYTKQVKAQTKSFCHLLLKPIQNLVGLKQDRNSINRAKTFANEQPKSDTRRYQNLGICKPLRQEFQT